MYPHTYSILSLFVYLITLSVSQVISSNGSTLMDYELETSRKEAVVIYFIVPNIFLQVLGKTAKNLTQDSRYSARTQVRNLANVGQKRQSLKNLFDVHL